MQTGSWVARAGPKSDPVRRRASGPRRARGIRVLATSIAGVVLAAVACSSSGGDGTAATSTTAPSSTTVTSTTAPSVDETVLGAYRAFWDAYLAAADPMDPEHPLLAQHATGEQLGILQRAFLARKAGGEVIRGALDLAPRVVSVLGDEATVRDCYLDNTGVFDAATGERKDRASGVRHLVSASMRLDGGSWKVSRIDKEGDGCTSA